VNCEEHERATATDTDDVENRMIVVLLASFSSYAFQLFRRRRFKFKVSQRLVYNSITRK